MPDTKKTRGRPFKKGQSGNPKGRPKLGESIADALRAAATAERLQALGEKAWTMAEQGDIRAMEFIRDSTDGKPAQRQILTGDPDAPVAIVAGPRKREKE